MKRKKGFTLLELIISMGLLGLILTGSFGLLNFGNKVHQSTIDEYDLQASIRKISDETNRIARFSTAVFTVPESSFRANNLTNGWSYVGVLNNAIVLYEYETVNEVTDHYLTELVPANPNITYKITFTKSAADHEEKIVGYSIQGFITGKEIEYDAYGNPIGHINIVSQTEALNSLQVIHKGTPSDPAVALAFRTQDRDSPEVQVTLPVAQVAMVLDRSGSMNYKLNGDYTHDDELRKISFLQNSAKILIDNFSSSGYPVSMALIPFSTTANNPGDFLNAKDDISILKNDIDALYADGGTNTGDGIRRAYHKILEGRTDPAYSGKELTDYIIILVDGVTTYATRTGPYINYPFRLDDINVPDPVKNTSGYWTWWGYVPPSGDIFGYGSSLDPQGTEYVNQIGNLIKADGNIKVYVIGFSSRSSDLASVDDIVSATGAEPKFLAGNEEELDLAFGAIQKEIVNDLWYIDGPDF